MNSESFASGVQSATVAQPVLRGSSPREMKNLHINEDLKKLLRSNSAFLESLGVNPMYDARIEEVNQRKIRIGNKWLADFASCNYLGFDLDPEIIASIQPVIEKWGTHPSWSRLLGTPYLYEEAEEEFSKLLGVEDALALPNCTQISHYCIFILSEGGEIFLDKLSHRTLYEGAKVAKGMGATLTYFKSTELEDLEQRLKNSTAPKKLICVDGVFSMHGRYADIPSLAALARKYDALLYIDDAHGFGVVGERGADESSPYGKKGNSIVNYYGESYDNIILITALSKSYSSYMAMITCSKELKRYFKSMVSPYLYSGPVPFASLATALKGFEVNRTRGDAIRADLYRKSKKLNDAINAMGLRNENNTDFPIFNFYLVDPSKVDEVSTYLFQEGIYVTLCPYPMVSKNDVGFRVQITAANTDEEVDHLIKVIENLQNLVELQKRL